MLAATFRTLGGMDNVHLVGSSLACLEAHGVALCAIGVQGVNAYVEPLVGLDPDVAVAVGDMAELARLVDAFPELRARVPLHRRDKLV